MLEKMALKGYRYQLTKASSNSAITNMIDNPGQACLRDSVMIDEKAAKIVISNKNRKYSGRRDDGDLSRSEA